MGTAKMKDAKLNAVLLLAKNYFRLSEIKVNVFADTIEMENVPAALMKYYEKKIRKMIFKDQRRAIAQIAEATSNAERE